MNLLSAGFSAPPSPKETNKAWLAKENYNGLGYIRARWINIENSLETVCVMLDLFTFNSCTFNTFFERLVFLPSHGLCALLPLHEWSCNAARCAVASKPSRARRTVMNILEPGGNHLEKNRVPNSKVSSDQHWNRWIGYQVRHVWATRGSPAQQ